MTITSAYAFLGFADLGLGSGVLNDITDAIARRDQLAARHSISTAVYLLASVAVALFVLFETALFMIGRSHHAWTFLHLDSDLEHTAHVLIACFALSLPISLVKRVQLAFQEGHCVSLWDTAASILGLLALIIVIGSKYGLPGLTLAVFGSTTAVLLTNYIIQFHRIRPWLRPSLALAERTTAVRLLRTGCLFLCLQMLAFLHTSVDNILVARFQGVACVPAYAVVQKIALLLLVVPQAGAAPLWAAFGDAVAHTDRDWIGRTLVQSVIAAGVYGAVAGCLLAVMGKSVIVWWLNGTVHAEPGVLAGFGVYIFVSAIALPLSSLASTSGLLRWNVLYSGLAILSAFGLKLWSLSTGSTSGVIWVMSPCLLVLYVLPLSYRLVRRPLIVR